MAQQSGCGGAVLSFTVKARVSGDGEAEADAARRAAFHVIDSTRVCSITANLGDTKTTITHPASTSHGRLTEVQRQAAGITQGLVRLSVGLDDVEDLKDDLLRGLNSL
jgi:O-succinylhomoserine sulfhydrylase